MKRFFPLIGLMVSLAIPMSASADSGTFSQTKRLPKLSRALVSSGTFNITQDKVLWRTELPYFSEVLIAGDIIKERYATTDTYQVTAQGQGVSSVSSVLALAVRGDYEKLEKYFVRTETDDTQVLVPEGDALKKLFKRISIKAINMTVHVDMLEASGAHTTILLTKAP